jgi:hypothetical protein
MKVNIHTQCSDFKLINRKVFSISIKWNKQLDMEVDAGGMTSASLMPQAAVFEGYLTYQLQKKFVKSDDQLDATYTLLFIAWKYEGYRNFQMVVKLIECDKRFCWNYMKLWEYYQRHADQLSIYTGPVKDTWLIYDGTVLMTRLKLDFTQRNGALNIAISKGIKDEHTKRPEWINPER